MRVPEISLGSAVAPVGQLTGGAATLASRIGAPGRRMLGEWASTVHAPHWPKPPSGEGASAILIPGFLAGDPSLTRMARWLKAGDFSLVRSGIRWNVDCLEDTVRSVEARLEAAVEKEGRRALVIGQSRGGVVGRVLAVRRPDLVGTLVTLGSPLRSQTAVHPRVWVSIGMVGGLGSLGVPGLLSHTCSNGDCCRDSRNEIAAPFPDDVRFISFYSRDDSVVRYEACLDPAAEHVEIGSSHLGMGVDARVWRILSRKLDRG
jgi:pimeloyl-ACP methyl ester carboxylesterase